MTISELQFRIEYRLGEILRGFQDLNKVEHFKYREGQSKRMCERSQDFSVICKVQNGESFRSSL
jgi:hypothetical protein